jgi:hypothetical protein
MVASIEKFARIYEQRPVRDNTGGMASPHLFLLWFVLGKLKPKTVVESGVLRGQGTWCIEQACPYAELYCLDLDFRPLQYRSKRARYIRRDFTRVNWGQLAEKDHSVLFFDDHQNAVERLIHARSMGFRHIMFEDNYVAPHADFYTLKMAFMHAGLNFVPAQHRSMGAWARRTLSRLAGRSGAEPKVVPGNTDDARFLFRTLEVYQELPPVFKSECTRWGTRWDNVNYPTPEPLLQQLEHEYQRVFLDEATEYTWMCYSRLGPL